MNPKRILYLLYCGTCVIAGLTLMADFYLPKKQENIRVTDTRIESSRTRSSSAHPYNYFLTIEGKKISVDGLVFTKTNRGDTVTVVKTTMLNRLYGFKVNDEVTRVAFSSLYNLFPLIPVLLLIPSLSFFVRRDTALSEFLVPLNLIVPIIIGLMELYS
ncbi:hypothetical protein [Pontibacter virosus]|uniref:Uncharacterized protein n=1 Tax=Pontibacter virosus TaxID=1765052 RepID=A0A2U1AV09_9BACT|nr:hypothetical protein [Pontibacter virosus]PVY40258.1 hypothetical protein C8E01_108152 [Pontibacter virosus]